MKPHQINISFGEETTKLLSLLAKQEEKTVPNLVKELILEALDRREDKILSSIAEERDTQHAIKVEHEDAWK